MAPTFSKINEVSDKTFDHVIIGKVQPQWWCTSTVAGCTPVSQLSENPDVTVLLLEAGKARIGDPLVDLLTGCLQQHGVPEYDWAFQTLPQKKLDGKVVTWNRGKGLGGSSNINYMENLGNPGWNYDSFIKYLKKAENLSTGVEVAAKKATEARGIPIFNGHENGKYSGAWAAPGSVNALTLTRCSAFVGYILPNLGRKNLFVLPEAYGSRIILGDSKSEPVTVEEVEFIQEDKTYRVKAAKEVIVFAGAFKFPQILELSGIGDPNVLKPLGIDVKVDLPGVGANLQEHTSSFTLAADKPSELKDDAPFITLDMLSDPVIFQKHSEFYGQRLPGLLSFQASGISYLSLQNISGKADEIIGKHEKTLATLPLTTSPATKEQTKIQLEHLK
ncbi:GMC oxidoreductase [Sphaerobolus stellatus SS14]|uniref:GMC oxidoreductase n=1 Tax=Sphaerobolus stellatus (strain SS14) TaxID=990650 RepID=A0A0C9ULE3_SPHS4|nr:GMC oxidoreductase [Sphaerobolus stellatus SS14]